VKLYHIPTKCHRRALPDRLAEPDFCTDDYRLRRIAGQYRVSLATAKTIIANCFTDGERR